MVMSVNSHPFLSKEWKRRRDEMLANYSGGYSQAELDFYKITTADIVSAEAPARFRMQTDPIATTYRKTKKTIDIREVVK